MAGVVKGSVAFYWLISTYELERPFDWLISLHKRACGVEVGREQGGGRLLKFLGEADESTEIRLTMLRWIAAEEPHVTLMSLSFTLKLQ